MGPIWMATRFPSTPGRFPSATPSPRAAAVAPDRTSGPSDPTIWMVPRMISSVGPLPAPVPVKVCRAKKARWAENSAPTECRHWTVAECNREACNQAECNQAECSREACNLEACNLEGCNRAVCRREVCKPGGMQPGGMQPGGMQPGGMQPGGQPLPPMGGAPGSMPPGPGTTPQPNNF